MNRKHWRILPQAPPSFFDEFSDLPKPVVQVLYNRGIRNLAQAQSFLSAGKGLLHDPFLLPDMDKAVARIYRALLSGETIAIFGDFDTDGVTSTALVFHGLRTLGGKAIPYIPHRAEEGHGLNLPALESLWLGGVSLIVTVDCGISSAREVEEIQRVGLDIIITDHHVVPPAMPKALATVNPQRSDSIYPFRHLAAVGLAYKLIEALYSTLGRHTDESLLELVALGTVGDIMPLVDENRYFVKRGLEILNHTASAGLREIIRCAGLSPGRINTEAISYMLAPRLNTTGRIAHAIESYKLLVTESQEEARELAEELERKNSERQKQTEVTFARAKAEVASRPSGDPIIIAGSEEYPGGIIGLVASKLVDEFYRPAIVMEIGKETTRGSARSIPEFNIIAALTQCSELFLRYGGHAQAAGFTIPTERLATLQERLQNITSSSLEGKELTPCIDIDMELPLSALTGDVIRCMERLAPFGQGNPAPVFLSRGVQVVDRRAIGNGGEHLRLKLLQKNITWYAIGFDMGKCAGEISQRVDVAYSLTTNRFAGVEALELNLLDIAAAE
ncbi:MAG: single-stranded-DNA-specific exonuclease RecJ [Chloroflexi bacterium]|nr:single-stranded-DNA-specific exonuclease RecJ [Chloroflexota bacterium]